MFMLDALQAPIKVALPGKKVAICNPMTLSQIVEWGTEIVEYNTALATEEMDEIRAKEFRAMYPPLQPDLNEFRRRVIAPDGIQKVLQFTLVGAQVKDENGKDCEPLKEDEVEFIIKRNKTHTLAQLAMALSGLFADPVAQSANQEGENRDPLKRTGKKGFPKSPSTGEKPLHSSVPVIQEQTLAS